MPRGHSELITSAANPVVKRARALADRKHRRRQGAFLVEGLQPTWRAVESGWPIEHLLVADDLLTQPDARRMVADLEDRGVDVARLDARVFAALSQRDGPTGIAAIVRPREASLDDIALPPASIVVVLERCHNPGNLGTIVRTADAAGAAGVILLGDGADPWAPAAVKASMGSIFALPIAAATLAEVTSWAGARGVGLVALTGSASAELWSGTWPQPCGILLGNEGEGLSAEALAAADLAVRIPMSGTAESLNLAAAAAIALYEARRRLG